MSKDKIKSISEIKKELKESKIDILLKESKISDDGKSLLLRVPQEIRKKFKLKAGDKLVFRGCFKEGKNPLLAINLKRC